MATDLGARPSLTIGQDMQEQEQYGPFLGVVVVDDWEPPRAEDIERATPDKPARWRLHIAIKPVDFEIGGDTGAFNKWLSHSDRTNSALGAFKEGLKEMVPTEMRIGEGDLLGLVALWERRTIVFGKAKDGTDMKAENIPIPLRPATPEEEARGKAVFEGRKVVAEAVPAAEAADLSEADVATVLKLIAGKKRGELQTAIFGDKTLSREVKQSVMSGKLLEQLVAEGKVTLTDGVYNAA